MYLFLVLTILCEEPDYSVSMLYGCKTIGLPKLTLRLYSCESLTLQFDWMEEACHNSYGGSTSDHDYTTGSPSGSPVDTRYGGGYSGHHESGSYYPSHGYPETIL
jgi:hypothetical protein